LQGGGGFGGWNVYWQAMGQFGGWSWGGLGFVVKVRVSVFLCRVWGGVCAGVINVGGWFLYSLRRGRVCFGDCFGRGKGVGIEGSGGGGGSRSIRGHCRAKGGRVV